MAPTIQDADLILKLYEMRRDPEMRRARAFVMNEFHVSSWDEVRPHYLTGDELDRHFRMVTSYWEMVAAFVNRGILDEDLFFDTHGEGLFIWNKIKHIVPEGRKHVRPTWLWNLERMARRQQAWRERSYPTAERVIEEGSTLARSLLPEADSPALLGADRPRERSAADRKSPAAPRAGAGPGKKRSR